MRSLPKFRSYDLTFREDALALLHRSTDSLETVAANLGVPKSTLYNWYKRDMAKKAKKKPGAGGVVGAAETAEDKLARLEAENEALRKKVARLEEDQDILKKFAAFSVREKT